MTNSVTILPNAEFKEFSNTERWLVAINGLAILVKPHRNSGICSITEELYSDKGWSVEFGFYATEEWAEKNAYEEKEGVKYVTGTEFKYKYVQLSSEELDQALGIPVDVIRHYCLTKLFPCRGKRNVTRKDRERYAPLIERHTSVLDAAFVRLKYHED